MPGRTVSHAGGARVEAMASLRQRLHGLEKHFLARVWSSAACTLPFRPRAALRWTWLGKEIICTRLEKNVEGSPGAA